MSKMRRVNLSPDREVKEGTMLKAQGNIQGRRRGPGHPRNG